MPAWRAISCGVCLLTLLSAACGATAPAESEPAPVAAVAPPTVPVVDPVPEQLPDAVARVNTHRITGDELERAVRSAEIQAGQALPAQLRDQVYRSVLDRLVSFHLLLQESETRRLTVDDAAIEQRLAGLRSNFPNDEAFESQLASWDTTIEILREETRRDMLVEQVLETVVMAGIDIDAGAARSFYDQHTEQFLEGGGARARHILIGISPDADAAAKALAHERAEALLREAQDGADFADLARTHSEDPGSASNGGDLGLVARGQTVPDFETALFALDTGEISGVVETPFGFHLIQLVALEEPRTVPFNEASGQIHEFLLRQEQQARTEAFVAELLANSDIEILI